MLARAERRRPLPALAAAQRRAHRAVRLLKVRGAPPVVGLDALLHGRLELRRLVARIAPQSEATYAEIEAAFGASRLAALLDELGDLAVVLDSVDEEVA